MSDRRLSRTAPIPRISSNARLAYRACASGARPTQTPSGSSSRMRLEGSFIAHPLPAAQYRTTTATTTGRWFPRAALGGARRPSAAARGAAVGQAHVGDAVPGGVEPGVGEVRSQHALGVAPGFFVRDL